MTEKIRLEIEDATDGGMKSVESGLKGIDKAADQTEQQLNQTAAAAEKIGDADDSVIDIVESLKDVKASLEGVEDESGVVARAIDKIGDADTELNKLRQQFRELQDDLNRVRRQAANTETALDQVGDADVDDVSPGLQGVEHDLNDVTRAAGKAEKGLHQAGTAAKGMGDKGGSSIKGMSLNVISFNQALEIGKKLIEGTRAAITALAADGSPAFVELNAAIETAYASLLKMADDPLIQSFAENTAGGLENRLIPAMSKGASAADNLFKVLKLGTLQLGEYTGVLEKGAAKQEFWYGKTVASQKEEIAGKREKIQVDDKIADIEKKIAEETQLRNIAQSNSRRQLLDLAAEETDLMREQERAGTATAKSRQDSLRKIELIQRRLIEVAKNEADAEIKEVERIAQERVDAHQRWLDAVKAGEQAQADIRKDELDKKTAEANAAADRLLNAIEQAKGPKGGNLLDEARAAISPEATRAQLVKQAKEAARQKYIEENRDKVDLEGKASGGTRAEQRQNQRKADREMELAEREAGMKAFRDFNDFTSGRSQMIADRQAKQRAAKPEKFDNVPRDDVNANQVDQAAIAGAQNTLIQNATKAAQGRGQLDDQTASALMQAAQNQQNMIATQERQAQQLRQIQAALGQAGNAAQRNLSAQSRKLGL